MTDDAPACPECSQHGRGLGMVTAPAHRVVVRGSKGGYTVTAELFTGTRPGDHLSLKDEARCGYWCECWTEDLTDEGEFVLQASFDAYTAPQADRWVAVALRTNSPAFDPEVSWLRFDGHHWCGGQAASAVSYSAGLR